jgi:prephenate dehydrogenase
MKNLGFLGPEGTYTELAAKRAAPKARRVPCASIETVFEALSGGKIDRGLVPIENVIFGPVTETLDNLYWYADKLAIVDTLVLPIAHAVGTLAKDPRRIKTIYSKDQALKQCSKFLEQTFPKATLVETSSTAAAMDQVIKKDLRDAAVIGNEEALRLYKLNIIARDVGNIQNNKTRFAVLARHADASLVKALCYATQIVVYPHHDRVGLLDALLSVISGKHQLNLHSIHSRPDTRGGFRFYLEIEGKADDAAVRACIAALEKQVLSATIEVKVCGSYPYYPFVESQIKTIGIIGGTGRMGHWFETFFQRAGYQVLISGRRTRLTYAACVKKSDVVLVNVPIKNTVAMIKQIGKSVRPGQLLVDNTSIKTQPVQAMLGVAKKGVEVLGMHTIFGPSVESVAGQNVVFTPTSTSGELAQEFKNIFFKYGANVTVTTPEHHDKQMALHQNLEHFSKIVTAQILAEHFPNVNELAAYASPHSRATLHTIQRILSGDPELYAEIQAFNLQGPKLIENFVKSAAKIAKVIRKKKVSEVVKQLKKTAQVLHQGGLDSKEKFLRN